MKKLVYFFSLAVVFTACSEEPKEDSLAIETYEQKVSYALGTSEASRIQTLPSSDKFDNQLILDGFKENFNATLPQECQQIMLNFLGANGDQYNASLQESGCTCIGKISAYQIFTQLNQFSKDQMIDTALLFAGVEYGLEGTDTTYLSKDDQKMALEEFNKGLQALYEEQMKTMQQEMESLYGENKEAGEQFLAENAKKPGIKVTESGLQYEVLRTGSGPKPTPQNRVTVHYTGMKLDGTVFESSYDGDPAVFGVTQVIAGWTEALQLMQKGTKMKIYIPQEIAYGANPRPGGPIQPYEALIFELEILEIQ